jgi:hypothetical protein
MENKKSIKNFTLNANKFRDANSEKLIGSINFSYANQSHNGQYWWCCKCGVCNEGSYCYKESCGHEQCSSCQI